MMFIQFLKNSFASQVSVKNYVSGARTWVLQHRGCVNGFDSIEIKQMFAAVDATSTHIPSPAYPLTVSHVKCICDYIDNCLTVPPAVKACILIGFTCFLRACNLLSPSTQNWLGPHTMLVSDIVETDFSLLVHLKSSKNFNSKNSKIIPVRKVENPKYCPFVAWILFKRRVNPCPIGPAFMVDDYTPLLSKNVLDVMNAALKTIIPSNAKISMHSLRRGGTQSAAAQGASDELLMEHGAWKSSKGLSYYLPKHKTRVPNIISNSLA